MRAATLRRLTGLSWAGRHDAFRSLTVAHRTHAVPTLSVRRAPSSRWAAALLAMLGADVGAVLALGPARLPVDLRAPGGLATWGGRMTVGSGHAVATVVGPDLALADAYATAATGQGPEALAWLRELPGIHALLIGTDGAGHRTAGLPEGA